MFAMIYNIHDQQELINRRYKRSTMCTNILSDNESCRFNQKSKPMNGCVSGKLRKQNRPGFVLRRIRSRIFCKEKLHSQATRKYSSSIRLLNYNPASVLRYDNVVFQTSRPITCPLPSSPSNNRRNRAIPYMPINESC